MRRVNATQEQVRNTSRAIPIMVDVLNELLSQAGYKPVVKKYAAELHVPIPNGVDILIDVKHLP